MKRLYYISTQPATLYYAWQVEVMVNNFLKHGISAENIHVVSAVKHGEIPREWERLRSHFTSVGFYFYDDERVNTIYPVTVRPHILKKHFRKHQYLSDEAVMYHDCDMVFTQPTEWEQFLTDDIWYLSDTIDYIGAKYIQSKKYGLYERMCEIVGISESIPIRNQKNSGGAQYIMKNLTVEYWEKVERDCDALYEFFIHHLRAFPQSKTYHPIQMWTAEMWAILWNAWYFKHETRVVPEMDFLWPNHHITEWNTKRIYHNAGVTGPDVNPELFYKGSYINTLPYTMNTTNFNDTKCSYGYVQEILETAKSSCLT